MRTKAAIKIETYHSAGNEHRPVSCGIVIFGASGDLTHRKLLPALYDLFYEQHLPQDFFIVGVARRSWKEAEFRREVIATLGGKTKPDKKKQREFAEHVYYREGDAGNPESFEQLARLLNELKTKYKTDGSTMFYLALPPAAHLATIKQLHEKDLLRQKKGGPWKRVIIEKPFGHDLDSARQLNRDIHQFLDEDQIYRIDHYLGKETVQNILMFRFANTIFEPLWNRQYIDHIQITAVETLGVEHRAGYYEHAGCLRDMFQNHILQLLTLCAMEAPSKFAPGLYRDEKVKVLQALRPIAPGKFDRHVVRGQYGRGTIAGKAVPGYRQEEGVDLDSNTETFAALKVFIDNWRWEDVPFYLRSGKRLNRQFTEIAIQFKQVPHSIFSSYAASDFAPNLLCFHIQPDEGISLRFEAKKPGIAPCLASLNLDFDYKSTFHTQLMGAYEHLLLDCMKGDQTQFVREDSVELSWGFITSILKQWEKSPLNFPNYAAGSWGPAEAQKLIEQDGRQWRSYAGNS